MGRKGSRNCKNLDLYCYRHRVINAAILKIYLRFLGIVTKYVFEDIETGDLKEFFFSSNLDMNELREKALIIRSTCSYRVINAVFFNIQLKSTTEYLWPKVCQIYRHKASNRNILNKIRHATFF
jgi:hypothetical protein